MSMCRNEGKTSVNRTMGCRVRTTLPWTSTPERMRPREPPVLRTPVMGLKAEARRLSYIKKKRISRSQSSLSRRSIHRTRRGWFGKKPRTVPAFPDSNREQTGRKSGTQWARTIINRLSFNKFFTKPS